MITIYVDLPTKFNEYENVAVFKGENAKQEAIEYCKENFGADDEGKVSLLTIDGYEGLEELEELEEEDDDPVQGLD